MTVSNPTYSFPDVNCSLTGPGGSLLLSEDGVADEGIEFTFQGDRNTMTTGASGDGMHSLHAGAPGTVILRLLKVSPLNALLSKMANAQFGNSAIHGQNTITLTDLKRGDNWTAAQCAFKKHADGRWAKEGNIVEWQLDAIRIFGQYGTGTPAAT